MRAIKGSSFALQSPVFVGSDEETATNATGTPTCAITALSGATHAAATVTQADAERDGEYQAAITTTHTANLDTLTATWTATVDGQTVVERQTIEIVGAFYASVREIRQSPGLENTTRFPLAQIKSVRDQYETRVEELMGQAFVPRFALETRPGSGSDFWVTDWLHPTAVRSVTVDGTAQTVGDFDVRGHGIQWSSRFSCSTEVAVAYEHGSTMREDLRREVLKAIRAELAAEASEQSSEIIASTFDGQTFRYSTPDPSRGRPTGIKTLDPVLVSIGLRTPGVA